MKEGGGGDISLSREETNKRVSGNENSFLLSDPSPSVMMSVQVRVQPNTTGLFHDYPSLAHGPKSEVS